MPIKVTTESFIKKAKLVHGDKYDYSKVDYVTASRKVIITCKIHGEFYQRPNDHKQGRGCPKCKGGIKYTQEEFINKSKLLYPHDNIKYDNVIYTNSITKVEFICKYHGSFSQSPQSHLAGKNGCIQCVSQYKANLFKDDIENIIIKANIKHNDFYEYLSINDFENHKSLMQIKCPKHGFFEQTVNGHLSGHGCYKCGREFVENSRLISTYELKQNIISKHGIKYLYPLLEEEHINYNSKITIICKEHGVFKQTIINHIHGQQCPKCNKTISKPEIEVAEFVKKLNLGILTSNRSIIKPYELDIYIPSLNKAIEFNGTYWHYSKRFFTPGKHSMKSNLCKEKGIKLLHIREDLWIRDKEQMKEVILKFINK